MLKVIKFEAEWCGPCLQMRPLFEEVIAAYKENPAIRIEVHNVDTAAELTIKYNITSIPALVFEKDGEVVSRMVGFRGKAEITKEIENFI